MRLDLRFKKRQLGIELFLLRFFPAVVNAQHQGKDQNDQELEKMMPDAMKREVSGRTKRKRHPRVITLHIVVHDQLLRRQADEQQTAENTKREQHIFFLKIKPGDEHPIVQVKEKDQEKVSEKIAAKSRNAYKIKRSRQVRRKKNRQRKHENAAHDVN